MSVVPNTPPADPAGGSHDSSSERAVAAPTGASTGPAADPGRLPAWRRILVIIAHPDDESFGLGGLIAAFTDRGAEVEVLCFTKGEASTLGGDRTDLAVVRTEELAAAGAALGTTGTILLDRPDGHLAELDEQHLLDDVTEALRQHRPDGILIFDPVGGVTGHEDHAAASRAAVAAGRAHGIPVLGWALPTSVADALNAEYGSAFVGYPETELHISVPVDRTRQQRAIAAHASQAVPGSVLWRRLELLGDHEHLRWVHRLEPSPST